MASGPSYGRIRTLVVEDKWLLRRATCKFLSREPRIEVVGAAADGLAALDKIRTLHPDLVVADIAMPNMSGLELTFLLRQRFPALRIVVVAVVNDPEIPQLCGLCGADALVNKALLPTALATVIRMIFNPGEYDGEDGSAVPEESEELEAEGAWKLSRRPLSRYPQG